jgi:ubiquinone/menaquinone biosynthesis C-methylase UbiE
MSLSERFFASTYDRFSAKAEQACFAEHRRALLPDLRGDVLEIGGGTGANMPYYGGGVASLTVTEPSKPMLGRLQRRINEHAPHATLLRAPAEDLPFEDESFDVVVSTLVLCSVDDQPRAVRELRRVLRRDGKLLFMEHVRSEEEKTARLQDRMNWLNRLVVHCDCNRPTLGTLRVEGFDIAHVSHTEIPKSPPFVGPLAVGAARALPRASPATLG